MATNTQDQSSWARQLSGIRLRKPFSWPRGEYTVFKQSQSPTFGNDLGFCLPTSPLTPGSGLCRLSLLKMYLLPVPKQVCSTSPFKPMTLPQQQKAPRVSVKWYNSMWLVETKRLTAAKRQTLYSRGMQDTHAAMHSPAHLCNGSTQLTCSSSWPKYCLGFCFAKAAAVARREELASFLPLPPQHQHFS